MYTVIGSVRSRAIRVLWALEEIDAPYEQIPAPPASDAMRAHNPSGKSPALKVGDVTLTDSVAIITYLADKHGALTFPAGTIERAQQDAVTQFCVDEIEGALWTAAKNSFVHPAELRAPEVKRVCRAEFATAMSRLEERLGDREFIVGDSFTIADLMLGHCAGWAVAAKFDLPGGSVGAYFERMRARPALHRAMARGAQAEKGG